MPTPIATAQVGDSRYEQQEESQKVFKSDVAFVPNDSNSAPTPIDLTLGGIFVRIRTNGDLVFWNGTSWLILNKSNILASANSYTDSQVATALHFEHYTNFTDLPLTGTTALITVDNDNSTNGDNTESQFIRQNNKYFYLVGVEQ